MLHWISTLRTASSACPLRARSDGVEGGTTVNESDNTGPPQVSATAAQRAATYGVFQTGALGPALRRLTELLKLSRPGAR